MISRARVHAHPRKEMSVRSPYDAAAVAVLMVVGMVIAVTRFRTYESAILPGRDRVTRRGAMFRCMLIW